MKIVALGDIHGNFPALEACIKNALSTEKPDGFVFLGDHIGDFLYGNKVIELIRKIQQKYPTWIVKGNREEYIVKQHNTENKTWDINSTQGIYILVDNQLTKEDMKFLSEIPSTQIINISGAEKILVTHQTPLKDKEKQVLEDIGIKKVLVGHTHYSGKWECNGIDLYNPGSVGLTEEGIPGATYGILELTGGNWDFRSKRVPYDYNLVIKDIINDPLINERCKEFGKYLRMSVQTGINYAVVYITEMKRLTKIYELSKESGKTPNYDPLDDFSDIWIIGKLGTVGPNNEPLKISKPLVLDKSGGTVKGMTLVDFDIGDSSKLSGKFNEMPQEIWDNARKNMEYYFEMNIHEILKTEENKKSGKTMNIHEILKSKEDKRSRG